MKNAENIDRRINYLYHTDYLYFMQSQFKAGNIGGTFVHTIINPGNTYPQKTKKYKFT
jgi:hypothetical protein